MNPHGDLQNHGFVYVATGDHFVGEAAVSAQSVKAHNPEPVCLITDQPCANPVFDHVILRPDLRRDVSAKLAMDACPFERFIFLDTDTYIAAPLGELFDVLDAFDLAVPAALGGYHYELPGCSPAFREHSTNVIAMKRGPALEAFMVRWRQYFAEYENVMGREWDQRSFRRAAYETVNLRLCSLGDEYSLSPYPGGLLCRDVRIFHGRPPAALREMERETNRRAGYRVYWGGFGCLHDMSSVTPAECFRFLGKTLRQFLRSSAKALLRK